MFKLHSADHGVCWKKLQNRTFAAIFQLMGRREFLRVENSWKLLATFVYVIANDVRICEGTTRPMKTKRRALSRHRRRNPLTFPEIIQKCV